MHSTEIYTFLCLFTMNENSMGLTRNLFCFNSAARLLSAACFSRAFIHVFRPNRYIFDCSAFVDTRVGQFFFRRKLYNFRIFGVILRIFRLRKKYGGSVIHLEMIGALLIGSNREKQIFGMFTFKRI